MGATVVPARASMAKALAALVLAAPAAAQTGVDANPPPARLFGHLISLGTNGAFRGERYP